MNNFAQNIQPSVHAETNCSLKNVSETGRSLSEKMSEIEKLTADMISATSDLKGKIFGSSLNAIAAEKGLSNAIDKGLSGRADIVLSNLQRLRNNISKLGAGI